MAYTRAWDEAFPPDTQAAKLLGQDIRQFKQDIRERVASFGADILANRPTPEPSYVGVVFFATDQKKMYRWDGSNWIDITAQILGTAVWGSITGNIADQTDVAPLNSPVLTGNPQAPNPPVADNDNSIATTAFVNALLATFTSDFVGTGGYIKLPFFGGFILQWVQGPVDGPGEASRTINWPLTFPVECWSAQVSMLTNGQNNNDCWYQIDSFTQSSITVYKQSTGGTTQNTNAICWGVGR